MCLLFERKKIKGSLRLPLLNWMAGNELKFMKVIEKIASWDNLLKAYEHAVKGRKEKLDVMRFTENFEENMLNLRKELISGTYKNGDYSIFYVHEPKKRMIMALPFKDRVAQWAIYLVVNEYLDKKMIYNSYACRTGKGQTRAVASAKRWSKIHQNGYYLKMDISKFFYRIDHEILIDILKRYYGDDTALMKIFNGIINCESMPFGLDRGRSIEDTDRKDMRYDVGLPIGNLTSQLFANLYLNELDQFVKHKLKVKHYERFADDVLIFSDNLAEIQQAKEAIELYVSWFLHLDFNNKTTIGKVKSGITFLGCRIFPNKLIITSSAKKKMKKNLLREAKRYARGKTTLEHANNVLMSYYGMLKHTECEGLMKWISNNYVLQRNRKEEKFKQEPRRKKDEN